MVDVLFEGRIPHLVMLVARAELGAVGILLPVVPGVRVADVTHHTLTVEATGQPEKMAALLPLLEDFGIVELARTGRVALSRGDRGIRERMLKAARAVGGEDTTDWDGGGV